MRSCDIFLATPTIDVQSDDRDAPSNALGFQLHSGEVVTMLASKTSGTAISEIDSLHFQF